MLAQCLNVRSSSHLRARLRDVVADVPLGVPWRVQALDGHRVEREHVAAVHGVGARGDGVDGAADDLNARDGGRHVAVAAGVVGMLMCR
jgi:hypothetical protein